MAVFQKNFFPKNDWHMTVWLSLDDTERFWFNMFLYSLAVIESDFGKRESIWGRMECCRLIEFITNERRENQKWQRSQNDLRYYSEFNLDFFKFYVNLLWLFAHSSEQKDLKRGVLIFWEKLWI